MWEKASLQHLKKDLKHTKTEGLLVFLLGTKIIERKIFIFAI